MKSASPRRSGGATVANNVQATLSSILAALGWVLVSLASLVAGSVMLVTTVALARNAGNNPSPAWLWILAVVLTFGAPFMLAAWKHYGDTRRIRATMVWLPAVWNTAALVLATQVIPDLTGTALRSVDWVVQGRLGDSHWGTRVLSSLGHEAAEIIDPMGEPKPAPPPVVDRSRIATEQMITLPLNEEGTAIMLDVGLYGSASDLRADYLFDTGASFTTITSEVAGRLGVNIPADAPTLKFNTASGAHESKMVFLPGLTLDKIDIPGLLVSLCDSCANEHTQGLLGLNVMREFIVQMDYQGKKMQLLPRIHEGRPNRSYDIQPVVRMDIEGRREIWLNRVRWVVLVHNRGSVAIEHIVPKVDFSAGPSLYGEVVERIEPGATGRSRVQGKVLAQGDDGPFFTLTLAEGYWE